jgi:hypothetical protein
MYVYDDGARIGSDRAPPREAARARRRAVRRRIAEAAISIRLDRLYAVVPVRLYYCCMHYYRY